MLQNHDKFMSALNISPEAHISDHDFPTEVTGSTNEDAASTFGVKNEEKHSISASARLTGRKM